MKRTIVVSLLLLFLFFSIGAVSSTLYIRTTTASLERIKLHQIENLRQDLIIPVQMVQSELYTVGRLPDNKVDTVRENLGRLEKSADKCTGCHHAVGTDRILRQIQATIQDYKKAFGTYMTAAGDTENINWMRLEAVTIGDNLLKITDQTSRGAGRIVAFMTDDALEQVATVKKILVVTTVVTFLFAVVVVYRLTTSIARPVNALVSAARTIASGNLGYLVTLKDKTEFGELANNFNIMSSALKDGYAKLEQEIAERKQTGTALVKSEAFLNTIFDSIHDPFCIFDREFRIVRANEAYAMMKSADLASLTARTCYEVFHGRTSSCVDCIVHKTFLASNACSKEKLAIDPEGHQRWLEIYTYPIIDSDGEITHVIEYTRDITERKRAEAALRESEQRYALAAEGANDGLWDWNLKDNKIYYSIRWKSMLGFQDAEIGNTPDEWFSRVHPDDREDLSARISAYVQQAYHHFDVEYRITHKDGTFRWMLCRGLAVKDEEGKACRMAGSQTDITARKTAEEQLFHDAFHDALTGLPNRALFRDRLQHSINRAKRAGDFLYAVMFFDVDRFKVINDSMGHAVGDKLLVEISKRMAACIRPGDTVARLGGDEFAILLENISDLQDATKAAERVQKACLPPFLIDGAEIYVTQSIGIAPRLDRYERPDQVLSDADIAMYAAKSKGKDRYEIFDDGMHSSIIERLQLEADLRVAVDYQKDFVLHYQPILDVNTGQLAGFEALVRWQHPQRGLLSPLEFIPVAEETGLIHPLGEWILRESCRQLKQWQIKYQTSRALKMSVNVSGRQFLRDDFAEKLISILNESGIDPNLLAIEVTESIIMEDVGLAVTTMSMLRNIGVQIHIDDFGTGYSSLSYLNKFPVTALKIDRSFISRMSLNEESREIVRTIISLAQNLNLSVIAEGVELSDQLIDISAMECQFAQGFYFSRPVAAHDLDAWMQSKDMVTVRA